MTFGRLVIFVAWSLTVLLVVGFLLVAFTIGDCMDVAACSTSKNRAVSMTLIAGFCTYWAVAVALFRRWYR